jgi:RecQ family ATP-dependent DNA helicase
VPAAGETDVHHLVPRAAGGQDDLGNLITLCDGCHAARHPNLQTSLARRTIERWGVRLARWLDRQHELGSLDESLGAAMRLLGVSRFRDAQLEVVLAALRGESVLFISATGSGKSLCFQLPVLLSRGTGMVISPLKALMNQQVSALQEKQIPSTFINGDLSPNEKKIRYRLLRQGSFKFLYCTPERFDADMVRPAEVEEICRTRPSYLVIDEAHCIDRWGKDFRPNYDRLGQVRTMLGDPPVLALTATAGVESQRRILQSLGIPDARVIVTGVNRPNIALARLADVDEPKRFRLIADLLTTLPSGRAMIFVPTVRTGKQLQDGLRALGREVPFYHSQLGTANERDMLLGQFTGRLEPRENVVICTNAFGMGLDVSDVRLVVHWQQPASVEDYLQEFGRAGRDGQPSVAILFTGPRDEGLLRYMAEQTSRSVADPERARAALEARTGAITDMRRRALARRSCFRALIVDYFGGARVVARRSWAVRIVRWIFSSERRTKGGEHCCDHCDGVSPRNVIRWTSAVLGSEAKPVSNIAR